MLKCPGGSRSTPSEGPPAPVQEVARESSDLKTSIFWEVFFLTIWLSTSGHSTVSLSGSWSESLPRWSLHRQLFFCSYNHLVKQLKTSRSTTQQHYSVFSAVEWRQAVAAQWNLCGRFTFTSHSASISFTLQCVNIFCLHCNQILCSQSQNIFDLYWNRSLFIKILRFEIIVFDTIENGKNDEDLKGGRELGEPLK